MGKQLLRIIILICSFAIELSVGYAIWVITVFLNGERIHDKLMEIGDAGEMCVSERLGILAGWLPMAAWILGFTWFQIRLLIDVISKLQAKISPN